MSAVAGSAFPDPRDVLFELIDGKEFAGVATAAFYDQPLDFATREGATAVIFTTGGQQGYIDRVDRATVEVYAPGQQAYRVAEAIRAKVVERGHDLAAGYVDSIACDITPHDVPHMVETVNLARVGFLITTRPS